MPEQTEPQFASDGVACPTLVVLDDNPLVTLIASEPGMAERLLTQHVEDGSGRCAVCTAGGQTGRLIWPCQTRLAADAARRPPPRSSRPEDAAPAAADPT